MLIQGGTVLDPAQNLHAVRDIALASGRVTAIAEHLTPAPGDEVIDSRLQRPHVPPAPFSGRPR
jgi:dihydroorotase-like cyclic amidohydrolase